MSSSPNALPLISVCIPAYNHEKYVQEAIRSVIDQDYPRIELIVIDDGSKDSTWKKIEELRPACEKRFERVVMYTRSNRGRVETGREIRTHWRGEFIAELASDDRYLQGALSKLVQPMIENPEIGLTVGRNIIIDSEGKRCYWDSHHDITYDAETARYLTFDDFLSQYNGVDINLNGPDFGRYSALTEKNHIGNGQLRRASLYPKIIPYDDKAPLEDLWFHLQLSKVAKYKYVDDDTFCYRWHGANTASQDEYMCKIINETFAREVELLNSGNVDPKWKREFRHTLPIHRSGFSVKLGNHQIRVGLDYLLDYRQYRISTPSFSFPLSPKLGYGWH